MSNNNERALEIIATATAKYDVEINSCRLWLKEYLEKGETQALTKIILELAKLERERESLIQVRNRLTLGGSL